MNLEKAIEIQKRDLIDRHPYTNPDVNEATQLLIEAGKAWKQFREGRWLSRRYDLPGETKE